MMRTILFVACVLFAGFFAQSTLAQALPDTLLIENEHIARRYLWNGGHLVSLSLEHKPSGKNWHMKEPKADFVLADLELEAVAASLEQVRVAGSKLEAAHQQVIVTTDYGSFWLRRVYRIYEDTPR